MSQQTNQPTNTGPTLTNSKQRLVHLDVLCGQRGTHPDGERGRGQPGNQPREQEFEVHFLQSGAFGMVFPRNRALP